MGNSTLVKNRTVLALYGDAATAHRVVQELVNHGFERGDIGLAVREIRATGQADGGEEVVHADEGAGFGAVIGGLTGLLLGLGAIIIPGIGPVIAAGPLAALLGGATGAAIGAGAGAITGGLTAGLLNLGIPEDETEYYAEAVRRGGSLVTVTTGEASTVDATEIMSGYNPINIDERRVQWLKDGWHGFDPMADPYTAEELARQREQWFSTNVDDDDTQPTIPAVRAYTRPRL